MENNEHFMAVRGFTVGIDGPAGSGKSSVAREAAVRLGIKYIDSGALYRSLTLYYLGEYPELRADMDFEKHFDSIRLSQTFGPDGGTTSFLNGKDISSLIRNEKIAANIGIISDNVKIRNFVNALLRLWGGAESIIMDGRDICSVVFPDADVKIYLDASVEIRAARRSNEYRQMGKNLDEMGIKKQIILRDRQDMNRPFGALKRTDDSIYIDSSNLTFIEVVERIIGIIKNSASFQSRENCYGSSCKS